MYNDRIFDVNEHSVHEIAAKLKSVGCVLIRNVLPAYGMKCAGFAVQENAKKLNKIFGKQVNDLPACFSDLSSDPVKISGVSRDWYYSGNRNFKQWFWDQHDRFSNDVLNRVIESKIVEIAKLYFEDDVVIPYDHASVRYHSSELINQSYFFHQDGSYHSRDPKEHTGLTSWIPFIDCDSDTPCLEVVPEALDHVMPLPEGQEMPFLFCDHDEVMNKYGSKLWAPEIKAGDIIMFNHFVIHRTYVKENMKVERQSIDIRYFANNNLPNYIGRKNCLKV